ncbi:hypothetical protein [Mesorhizobium sp.]|nr:hypothetical protein [Mesorhizobium sp.]
MKNEYDTTTLNSGLTRRSVLIGAVAGFAATADGLVERVRASQSGGQDE